MDDLKKYDKILPKITLGVFINESFRTIQTTY
jgi:hypothetical protein